MSVARPGTVTVDDDQAGNSLSDLPLPMGKRPRGRRRTERRCLWSWKWLRSSRSRRSSIQGQTDRLTSLAGASLEKTVLVTTTHGLPHAGQPNNPTVRYVCRHIFSLPQAPRPLAAEHTCRRATAGLFPASRFEKTTEGRRAAITRCHT